MANVLGGAASGAAAGSMLGPWGAAAGGLIGGIGSAIGGLFGGADEEAADEFYKQNYLRAEGLTNTPEQLVGLQGASDPRLVGAQQEALANMRQRAMSGGLDPQARAQLAASQAQAAQGYGSRLQGIQQQAQRFGGNRGPLGYLASLQASHDVANQESLAGAQAAGGAATRGQLANEQFAGQAGNMRSAQDAIARYNASLRQAVESRNVAGQNQMKQFKYNAGANASAARAGIKMGDAEYGRPAVNAITQAAANAPGLIDNLGRSQGWWGGGGGGGTTAAGPQSEWDQVGKMKY